jgi:hypothetical protein
MLVLAGRDAAWHPFPFLPYARPHTTAPHTKIKPHKTVRFYSADRCAADEAAKQEIRGKSCRVAVVLLDD